MTVITNDGALDEAVAADGDATVHELDDPTRGCRRVVLGDDGLPVRVELADGRSLRIARDEAQRTMSVTDDAGVQLISLRALGDAGLDDARPSRWRSANRDGSCRLSAADPGGVTVADVSETMVRVERNGAVLRIDSDADGRPARVTIPGCAADLEYRSTGAGCWEIGHLGAEAMLRVTAAQDGPTFDIGAGSGWIERRRGDVLAVTRLDGTPLVDVTFDLADRVVGRTWHGGTTHRYRRDERQRLASWTSVEPSGRVHRAERRYRDNELAEVATDARRRVLRTDDGGRITRMIDPHGTVAYRFDPNGRRIARTQRGAETKYAYDVLGQLTEVRSSGGEVSRYGWDALGRRVWIEHAGRRLHEHRDTAGRLWSVTDDHGDLVHHFIWWEGRVVARCDSHGELDEVYLTDSVGTLLGVGTSCADPAGGSSSASSRTWRFEEAIQPPFGEVAAPWRPTLFGHIADGCTPLICFGARELDTETGVFLTPDPWHGGLDDPRHIGGQSAGSVLLARESPLDGIHPYALSQHDPLGRPDLDGHFAWGHLFFTLLLGSTWGFPLTSVSVFLFEPINLYFEVIGLIITLFRWGTHPWPQHSLGTMRGFSGSGRMGTFALALNGFLPRVTGGIKSDRCVTIGHVVWENRRYFNLIDRPRVLELDDVRGTPQPADGKPSADGRKFSDSSKGSVLAVISTDGDHRTWVHGTWWTRGPGNAVGVRGAAQSFEDRVSAGTLHARGTVFLAQPLPEVMPWPRKAGDSGQLEVVEYGAGPGTRTSTGELVQNVWFAFEVPTSAGLAANTVIEVKANAAVAPAYGKVLQVLAAGEPIAILDHELPQRFTNPPQPRDGIKLRKMNPAAATSANWAVGGGPAGRSLQLAAPAHPVAVDDVFEFGPTAPGPTSTPERPKIYSRIAKVTTTVQLSPTIGGLALGGGSMFRMTTDGTALSGNFPGPASPDQFTIAGSHKLVVGDFVAVQPATPGATPHYARITVVVPAVAAVAPVGPTPGKPSVPSKLTVDPPFTLAAATAVRVTRLKESNRALDTGANAVASGDQLTVEVRSSSIFAVDHPVKVEAGGAQHVRRIAALSMVAIETVDDLAGTAPFTLTRYDAAASTISSKLSSSRFVKHTGGDPPSTYGAWPAEMMGLVPADYLAERAPMGWRFFLKSSPPAPGLHPKFRDFWEPLTLGTTNYWLLTSELKIVDDGGTLFWEPDPDDTYPRRHRQRLTSPIKVNVRSVSATGVKRPDAGGGKVFAFAAETQVPEEPRVRWSLADALAEHELSHTVQNKYWGPMLGALPLQGIFRSIRDVVAASADEPHEWMDWTPFDKLDPSVGFNDTNVVELLSIGGIMQLAWTFVILGPALGKDSAREYLLSRDFDDWAKIFNPVNRQIINAIPRVDHDVPETHDWKTVLKNVAAHALDLRSWTPFVGFVPLMLPDSPKNFLEQQASRWTGDLYSTILTANDRFNVKHSAIGNDRTDANLGAPVGDAVRLLSYYSDPLARNLPLDECDAPGSHLTQLSEYNTSGRNRRFIEVEQASAAGVAVLVHADLFDHVRGPAPGPPVQIDGPVPVGGGAAPRISFLRVPVGCVLKPALRSVVPIPPAVVRAAGFYLLSASPGTWKVSAYDDYTGTADDPHTSEAVITFASTVRLGADDVAWTEPFATGVAPSAPPAAVVERFVTEKDTLTVRDRNTSTWVATADAGVTLTPRAGGRGWEVAVAAPGGGVALPKDARVRVWAKVAKDDPEIFDLHHDQVPTLRGRRSYLDEDTWIPVRDFLVRVKDLPVLAAAPFNASEQFDLDVPVKLAGPADIVPTGNLVKVDRVQDVAPRGERWRFQLKGRKAVEAQRVVPVTVRFGPAAAPLERKFDLTINPNFTLDKPVAVARYEVTPAAPLVLTVNGGAGGFSVVDAPPAASRAKVVAAGTTVTITVDPRPPAPPPPAPPPPAPPPVNYDLVVKDSAGHLGILTITIRP